MPSPAPSSLSLTTKRLKRRKHVVIFSREAYSVHPPHLSGIVSLSPRLTVQKLTVPWIEATSSVSLLFEKIHLCPQCLNVTSQLVQILGEKEGYSLLPTPLPWKTLNSWKTDPGTSRHVRVCNWWVIETNGEAAVKLQMPMWFYHATAGPSFSMMWKRGLKSRMPF